MFKFFGKHFGILKQGILDIKNFIKFRKTIITEEQSPKSKFNELGLHANKLKNIIYTVKDIPENYETAGTDAMKYYYLIDLCRPINNYFQSTLNWGEYMIYEFWHFENLDEPKENVFTYQIEWHFKPICLFRPMFWFDLVIACGAAAALVCGLKVLIPIIL